MSFEYAVMASPTFVGTSTLRRASDTICIHKARPPLRLVLVVTVTTERRRVDRRVQVRRYGPVGRIPETGAGHVQPGTGWTGPFALVPQLPHLVPPLPHQRLVLGYPHLLAVHDARPFRSGSIPIVRVLFHVQLGQPGLFLVVRLLVRVRHCLPPATCSERHKSRNYYQVYTIIGEKIIV